MDTVEELTRKLKSTIAEIYKLESLMEDSTDSFALEMNLESLAARKHALEQKIRAERELHGVDVIEIRLIGEVADEGRLPLEVMGGISLNAARALYGGAYFMRNQQTMRKIPHTLSEELAVSFAGTEPGSTRIFITVNSQPDLFNQSLSESVISSYFSLFQAQTDDALANAVETVGKKNSERIADLLTGIVQYDLSVEVSWADSSRRYHVWSANTSEARSLRKRLSRFEEEPPRRHLIRGIVARLDRSGTIAIRIHSGQQTLVKYPAAMMSAIEELHLNQEVSALIESTVLRNSISGTEQTRNTLIKVTPK